MTFKFRLTASKFKTKKEAYATFLVYLTTPWFVALALFYGIGKLSFTLHILAPDQTRQNTVIAIIIVALVLLYSWYKMFRLFFIMNSKDYDALPEGIDIPKTVKCLNCKEPFSGKYLTTLTCPKCGGTLENIHGFFERHPELRNETDNKRI